MKAVGLLSGGMDSATTLAIARSKGFECHALSIAYGQRHASELDAAGKIAKKLGAVKHQTITVNLNQVGGSALTDHSIAVPETPTTDIPVTYVPARNTLFLSLALGLAEVIGSSDLFIGVNARDYSGYPDCRPEFIESFERLAALATKAGVSGGPAFKIHAPMIHMSKSEIIQLGLSLNVDYRSTVSCYQADSAGRACGRCDACRIRREGFLSAGIADATNYVAGVL